MTKAKRVLICPLDWGLGHATRMVPLITYLLKVKVDVQLAAGERTLSVLQNEFPQLKTHLLPTVAPNYSKFKNLLFFKVLAQLPFMAIKVWKERKTAIQIIQNEHIDLVISDNRFGMWCLPVKSAYITHQITFKLQGFLQIFNPVFEWGHRLLIHRHDICFIPDDEKLRLAGDLANTQKLNVKFAFMGLLSRLKNFNFNKEEKGFVLIVLSGQEPQRTLLEQKLVAQIEGLNHTFALVRGKPQDSSDVHLSKAVNLKVIPYANKEELSELMQRAEVVVCRSGYSSIMDLIRFKKKAILVPTPGQAEQEYLAQYYKQKGWFFVQEQGYLDLKRALKMYHQQNPPKYAFSNEFKMVEKWINEN